ncbi:type I restriction modification DNA specificity protein [Acidovorax sp. 56]|uniref:restriction endonuclease subunit S n=1 Tax=Acidovorax sp. 56 TaxID=2035205 RepID=UPI000C1709DC|nr:restriction endonuclease subunit S [Acidovorax sp. 56]PIF28122.1 type I restriction modification DNA specificity protein [Acidovorax sp. 56]
MPPSLTTVGSVLRGIVSGKSVQTLERPAQDNELGILKVSAVTWGSFRPNENKALPPSYDPKDCPRPMNGDILISRANTRELVGAPVMVHGDYPHLLLSDKLLKLLPDESAVDARYLVRALRSPSASAHFFQCAGGSSGSMTNITQSDIRSAPIYLPSLEEQRRIAAILDQAETLRTQRRTALTLLDSLTQSLFLDMFGDPVANPKGWQLEKLGKLTSKMGSGSTPSGGDAAYKTEGISLIRSLNVHDGNFKYKNLAYIDEVQAAKLSNVQVAEGDVLLNITGASVARVCRAPADVLPARVNQHVMIVRPKAALNGVFLERMLLSETMKRALLQIGGAGATREAITKAQAEELLVPLPPSPSNKPSPPASPPSKPSKPPTAAPWPRWMRCLPRCSSGRLRGSCEERPRPGGKGKSLNFPMDSMT